MKNISCLITMLLIALVLSACTIVTSLRPNSHEADIKKSIESLCEINTEISNKLLQPFTQEYTKNRDMMKEALGQLAKSDKKIARKIIEGYDGEAGYLYFDLDLATLNNDQLVLLGKLVESRNKAAALSYVLTTMKKHLRVYKFIIFAVKENLYREEYMEWEMDLKKRNIELEGLLKLKEKFETQN